MPKRKLKGMEVAQVALLLVLAVAVAVALYLIVSGMIAGTPVPKVQLDPYSSKVVGTRAYVVLKFGENARTINSIQMLDATGASVGSCGRPTGPFRAGHSYEVQCSLSQLPSGRVIVRVDYVAGDGSRKIANLEWIIG